MTCALETISMW